MAKIALSFDAWKPGRVAPATVEVPVNVLDIKDSKQIRSTFSGHSNPVAILAFSPDGRLLASSTFEGEVKLWDIAAAKERLTFPASASYVNGLAFTPDRRTLAVSYMGKTQPASGEIKLWDVATGKERTVLKQDPPGQVFRLAMAPDGQSLATHEVRQDGKQRKIETTIWDLKTGRVRLSIPGDAGLAFSPDSKTVAVGVRSFPDSGTVRQDIRLYDAFTGKLQATLEGQPDKWFHFLAFAPDGKMLAQAEVQGSVTFWDLTTGKVKAVLQHGSMERLQALAFSPDGATLATALGNHGQVIEPREVVLWDVATEQRRSELWGHKGAVQALAFSPDGKLLATGGDDNTIKLWNLDKPPVGAAP